MQSEEGEGAAPDGSIPWNMMQNYPKWIKIWSQRHLTRHNGGTCSHNHASKIMMMMVSPKGEMGRGLELNGLNSRDKSSCLQV